jgi:YD repeat-containing protein
MSAVSQPYAPGATVYWTTYTYDGSGRTLAVTAPDGNSTTTYTYQGNSTMVADPAGKWKTSTVDAYGNAIQVTEPNPAGGTFATNYTYTPANQLTGVSMTRGNVTQTRTYLYNGSVTYNYSATQNNGRITSSVDGMTGENMTYTYDALNRLTAASNSLWSQTYTYDGFGNLLTKSQANGSPNPSPAMSVSYNANNQQTAGVADAVHVRFLWATEPGAIHRGRERYKRRHPVRDLLLRQQLPRRRPWLHPSPKRARAVDGRGLRRRGSGRL